MKSWKPAVTWDCDRARTSVERLICAVPDVHAQDIRMGALYSQLLARGLAPEQMQKDWLRKHREACDTADCLRAVYAQRISHFEALLATDTAAAHPPPKATAPATSRLPEATTPANLNIDDTSAATPATDMSVVSPPPSFPASAIPQLPLPEVPTPVTTDQPQVSPKGTGSLFWVALLAVAMALGLFTWRGRSRTSSKPPFYDRLPAALRHIGRHGQPRARMQSLRLDVETHHRLIELRRPGESLAEVVTRAVTALEATTDPPSTDERLATLERRLKRLEGSR